MQPFDSLNDDKDPSFPRRDGDDGGRPDPLSEQQPTDSSQQAPVPPIEPEPADRIDVGAGGQLFVPREDIGDDLDAGDDLDLAAMQAKKHRKPTRREWFALNPASELPTRLLLHKPKADGMDTEYYYVAPNLRGPIIDELKSCRIFVYYSFSTKTHALWIIHVTLENSWYESLQALLRQPEELFKEKAIRVMSDKPNSRYRVKHKPLPAPVTWPTNSTEVLLGEALGADKFITSADHPLYRDLIDGVEIT